MLLIESLFLQCFAIALGACIGSFLNVVIYRVPAGLSILYPPSRCPHCLRQLAPRDNIPVIGWFLIKGKCRYCHTSVSWRYPAIEALTAFLFWCVAAYFGTSQPIIILGFYAAFLSWLLALSMIDIDTQTLPNSLTQSGLVVGLIYQGSLAFINSGDRTNFAGNLLNGIIGSVVAIWSLGILGFVMNLIKQKETLGGGDPKLLAMIAMWLGYQNILPVLLIAAPAGIFVWMIAWIARNFAKDIQITFGPMLAIGGGISLFFGDAIVSNVLNYVKLVIPFIR